MTKLQMLVQMAKMVQYVHLGYEKTSTDLVESISEKNFFLAFYGFTEKATNVAKVLLKQQKQQIFCFFLRRWVWFIMVYEKCLKDICLHSLTSYNIRNDPTALPKPSVAVILAFFGIF